MKILMLTSSYPTKGYNSGAFVKNIAKALVEQDISVTVMMFSSRGRFEDYLDEKVKVIEYPYSLILPPSLHKHRGLIPSIKKSLLAKIEFPMYLGSSLYYLSKFSRDFDIIHAHWVVPAGFVAAVNKKIVNKPLITTAWGAEYHLPNNFAVRKILRFVHENSDVIAAVSEYMRSRASKYGLNTDAIKVISNSVDLEQFERNRKPQNKIIIGTVRRLVKEKRINDLIEAVGLLPGEAKEKIELWIVGDGPEKKRLIHLVERLNLESITTFYGMVKHEKVPELLNIIDVYVNPSVQEGMATANLEAMACGCCVVATGGYGNDELIEHNVNGVLFEKRSIKELSKILNNFINSASLRSRISKEATIKSQGFSSKKVARQYLEYYKYLYENKRA